MKNENIYHTYFAYQIQNIRLDKIGKHPTIGAVSRYIEILENFSNTTKLFPTQLIIISCGGLDITLEKLINIYREIDDAIVIMHSMPLTSSISEEEIFGIGKYYGFTKVTDNQVFNKEHTFMILNTTMGKELIETIKNKK